MIVCQCNVISDRQIKEVVEELANREVPQIITPGRVYARCGKRPNCGRCMAGIVDIISKCLVHADSHAVAHGLHAHHVVSEHSSEISEHSSLSVVWNNSKLLPSEDLPATNEDSAAEVGKVSGPDRAQKPRK